MSNDKPVGKCPVMHHRHTAVGNTANQHWWPEQLNLEILHQNTPESSPMAEDFNYAEAFESVDLDVLKTELVELMTRSRDWWPADYGHYGPLFVRMAWHSAGTYRVGDGRGGAGSGTLRFAPLNSWPDNVNLDKARRLLWPLKKKYGRKISLADLMIFAGTCALECMGLESFGFAGGREDRWAPEQDIYWGPETTWLGDARYSGERELDAPLGAVQMGLIYVNPEGPGGVPDPLAAARDIRETFARMAMNDEETVALIAGGHTFGKSHGAASADHVGPEPEAATLAEQGLGWRNGFGSGKGADTISSGLEGAWTSNPAQWDNGFFDNLFGYEWVQSESPAGAIQWRPKDSAADGSVPDAHDPAKRHAPMMLTTDLALRMDPSYAKIAKHFHAHPQAFAEAFSRAWFKLTHRDMGPRARYLGALAPKQALLWQDPLPEPSGAPLETEDIAALERELRRSGLSISQRVATAWASASSFRGSDMRGGANGARLRLAPQKDWEANSPASLAEVLDKLEAIREAFNRASARQVSLADLIVLAGNTAVEDAARVAGHELQVRFTPGRVDASAEQTDIDSFAVLEPHADGFRNYLRPGQAQRAEALLVDRAQQLTLSAPEMSVLLGGLRVLDVNTGGSQLGVFTQRPGVLSNDFFVNLLDPETAWSPALGSEGEYEGRARSSGELRWRGSRVDLVFGSNSRLRALAEVYASDDAEADFVRDFAAVWAKVMELDRF